MKNTFLIFSFLFLMQYTYAQTKSDDNIETNTTQAPTKNQNTVIIGYQIGGHSAIGLDYEIRVDDHFGIHFGGGFLGYTAGLKIHTKPHRTSSYFDLNFKDGGFGQYQTAGVEYGGRWVFNKQKSDFGLHFQIGIAAITEMTDEFKELAYGDKEAPSTTLTLGVGLAF